MQSEQSGQITSTAAATDLAGPVARPRRSDVDPLEEQREHSAALRQVVVAGAGPRMVRVRGRLIDTPRSFSADSRSRAMLVSIRAKARRPQTAARLSARAAPRSGQPRGLAGLDSAPGGPDHGR